ncbi:8-amino-7-oxononanoate synthase [Pseudoflavonifractor sp. 60]|uniref:8-amino-7-oxononanoate synthase n=1 Tax=Pseudoflavonifractor sp. 60 TaxID=2304576 RepID=UPI001FACF025|nr:8-amino-7-oxononanoate synthase [Pseudoflavonifractor sp. 60]
MDLVSRSSGVELRKKGRVAMPLYSVKMRASADDQHISGAEKIVPPHQIAPCAARLIQRAMSHAKGEPDQLHIKIEKLEEAGILFLDALPVRTLEVDNCRSGLEQVREFLRRLQISRVEEIIALLPKTYAMRGAMLLDVDTLERLEPDWERGVRATCMDAQRAGLPAGAEKNHFAEAIVLATKVAHAPNIIGELCISDDPEYVTGYAASLTTGYLRITKLKPLGSEQGGRIFLYRGDQSQVDRTISFLQEQPVIVRNVPVLAPPQPLCGKLAFLDEALERIQNNHLYRRMTPLQSAQSATVCCQGRELLMLASNHYLDMACVDEVKSYAAQVLGQYGAGSGGSRLTTGNTELHELLEQRIAEFKGTEAALVFNSGYVANLAAISSLMGRGDVIFSDELNHASIIDGCRLSRAEVVVYRHNDMDDLERKLWENPCGRGMVVSDGVFSMDGDILNLPRFVELANRYGLLSMVDEAHSTGVIGAAGRGIVEYYGGSCKPDILMGTLSKSVGSEGGFVCGSRTLIDYLVNRARGFIFSTALSPVTIAASIKALEYIEEHPERVRALQENVKFFCGCLKQQGVNACSETAIVPILIGDEQTAMEVSQALFDAGFFLSAIRYPTVEKGGARLRAALMATHTREQLQAAADAIAGVLREKMLL